MRPTVFQVGGVLYWVIQTRNPDTMVLKDADSTPTVAVRKNGSSVTDSVTVAKRSATTGIYDCSYDPASEVEGDAFTFEESATVTGTTTSSATYTQSWNARVIAVERGTDGALKPKTAGRDIDVAATTGAVVLDSSSRVKLATDQPDYAPLKVSDYTAPANSNIAAIKAKTDNLPSDPASATLVGEAADAILTDIAAVKTDTGNLVDRITENLFAGITYIRDWFGILAGKLSEPVALAEIQATLAGETYNNATDSLQAIRDNQSSGGGASLTDIIAGVQSVSGGIVAAQDESAFYITIGDTWTQAATSLGNLTNKTVSFAIKAKARDTDNESIIRIVEGSGLIRLNGAATTAGWGSITIDDDVAGDITLRLESDATSLLTSGTYIDAIKGLQDGDDRTLRQRGKTIVSVGVIADIT
jgi:hypothetical protein